MESISAGRLLSHINYPAELRQLPENELHEFCQELRTYIINHCAQYGGHFGASLGVVEITTALHYAFNTPDDLIVWDVGHQAYGHKIITGRRQDFFTNRIYRGISGFPKRQESIFDTFGVGHSSTSISAALGMATALAKQDQKERQVVAVIGDGAMTAGLAFEALNNAGISNQNLLIILNDNCMSIDPNVGALKEYLVDITSSRTYNRLRNDIWNLLGRFKSVGPKARKFAAKIEQMFTASATKPGMLFESLGMRYFGPVDGHDVNHLVRLFKDLQAIKGVKLLHCVTVKGKGFAPAEADQTKWHAPGFKFDIDTGAPIVSGGNQKTKPPKYQDVFGETLIELAKADKRIVAITPAMPSGSGLVPMFEQMPDRCFDVGIAEQHAVTFSAGLASQGMLPFCNIYSSFMQRAYDQVIHDVAIQNLKVIFCLDRAGLVGADGATHHGAYDICYLRCLPNLIISSPLNESELRNLMYTAAQDSVKNSFCIRYPRGEGVMTHWRTDFEMIEIGTGRMLTAGEDLAILSFGPIGNLAAAAIQKLNAAGFYPAHYDMRFVKPLDEKLLHSIAKKFNSILTIEDGALMGGFGSAILEFMADNNYHLTIKRLGIPDLVIEHGTQNELYRECGYDTEAIETAAKKMMAQPVWV
jgi:1-deoxy-D-xylulose-5-phosphate synthase